MNAIRKLNCISFIWQTWFYQDHRSQSSFKHILKQVFNPAFQNIKLERMTRVPNVRFYCIDGRFYYCRHEQASILP